MEYNLKITTDDSELQDTQDLLVEIGDTANELHQPMRCPHGCLVLSALPQQTELWDSTDVRGDRH